MAKSSNIKNLNAPKKSTWVIAFFAAIIGVVLAIVAACTGEGFSVVGLISVILLFASSVIMLLSSYLKGM